MGNSGAFECIPDHSNCQRSQEISQKIVTLIRLEKMKPPKNDISGFLGQKKEKKIVKNPCDFLSSSTLMEKYDHAKAVESCK